MKSRKQQQPSITPPQRQFQRSQAHRITNIKYNRDAIEKRPNNQPQNEPNTTLLLHLGYPPRLTTKHSARYDRLLADRRDEARTRRETERSYSRWTRTGVVGWYLNRSEQEPFWVSRQVPRSSCHRSSSIDPALKAKYAEVKARLGKGRRDMVLTEGEKGVLRGNWNRYAAGVVGRRENSMAEEAKQKQKQKLKDRNDLEDILAKLKGAAKVVPSLTQQQQPQQTRGQDLQRQRQLSGGDAGGFGITTTQPAVIVEEMWEKPGHSQEYRYEEYHWEF